MIVVASNNGREIQIKPKVFINGFPKSGLHLTELMVTCMAKPFVEKPWVGSFKGNAWLTEYQDMEHMKARFWCPTPDTYIKGHCGYTDEIGKMLYDFDYAVIFVCRDLRDVAVSQSHHVTDDDKRLIHPDKEIYQKLKTHEEVLKAVITGLEDYPGLIERWEQYAGWFDTRWALKLHFEHVLHNARATAELMIRYVYGRAAQIKGMKLTLNGKDVDNMISAMLKMSRRTELSATFRKGTTGQWREEFTPEIKELFKERAGNWLTRMGYEKDNDW
jgi:hypothetical protein